MAAASAAAFFGCRSNPVTESFSRDKNQLSTRLAVTDLVDSNPEVGLFDVLLVVQVVRGLGHSNPPGF